MDKCPKTRKKRTVEKMVDIKEISKLFENDKFQKFSIYFFEQPRSVREVAELSKVSKTKIYQDVKKFKIEEHIAGRKIERYDSNYIKMESKHLRKLLYFFTQRVLIDWLKIEIALNEENVRVLERILNEPAIDKVVRSGNQSWSDVLTKLAFILITLKIWHLRTKNKEIPLFLLPEMSNPELFACLKKEDVNNFILAIEKAANTEKQLAFELADKIIDASIQITFTTKDYDKFVFGISDSYAKCVIRLYKKLLFRFPRYKRIIDRILVEAFVKEPEKKP